jgi:hypothetical protein
MCSDEPKPARSWQEIAAEASREKDPQRLIQLTQELERAFEERDARRAAVRKSAGAPGK